MIPFKHEKNVAKFLRMIRPYSVGMRKVRYGSEYDGGYVVLPSVCDQSEYLHSYGVGDDVRFELDFVANNTQCLAKLFDPNIMFLPQDHPRFEFCSGGIGNSNAFPPNTTLKVDVEWNEWQWLEMVHLWDLKNCLQIIIELHLIPVEIPFGLSPYFRAVYGGVYRHINDALFGMYRRGLEKLMKNHYLFHVHPNNSLPQVYIEGLLFPPLLEVSFVRKDIADKCSRKPKEVSLDVFPRTTLDRPNKIDRPDIKLRWKSWKE